MSSVAIHDPGYVSFLDLPRQAIFGAYHTIRETIEKVQAAIERLSPFQQLLVKTAIGFMLGVTLMPVRFGIVFLVISCIGRQKFFTLSEKSAPSYDDMDLSKMGLLVCVVGPILEEVIFRGIVQPVIKFTVKHLAQVMVSEETARKIATITAIGLTAIFFGLLHFDNHAHWLLALPQVINATFGGIVYGIEKEYGTLAMPIAQHIANNTVAFCL